MKLKSLNKYASLLIFIISFLPLNAEEQIDIWDNEEVIKREEKKSEIDISISTNNSSILNKIQNSTIEIENELLDSNQDAEIFGIFEPAESDFNLNMWSKTSADDIRSSIKRINKMELSNTSEKIFEKTLFSFAYPPKGMSDKEFTTLKINWMINNKKSDLIENFLNQNNAFHNKEKVIQYLVDENIAKANIKESCDKINFIDKNIKDSYLEKFKIYCLVFDNKKNEAQLLYDILNEQDQSDKFFDDKINFLLGITDKTSSKINEDNLLNFYLSSITIKDFKYEPTKKTKKIIWEYLNAANLIKFEDISNKEKLKNLEIAANQGQLDTRKIFDIYKKIPFDLNSLINASNIYQTLNSSDSRALIYQKYLLSDSDEIKVKFLFLLKDLFKKDNLRNIYTKFLSDRLKEIDIKKIPEAYQEALEKNIISEEDLKLGKIKYDDKILHRSRLLKYYTENENQKKVQKDLNKIYKKIKRNKKYFYSARDLSLIDSLINDGFKIPNDLNYQKLFAKYEVPPNLLQLAERNQSAFLTLKIVEIIGEDEPYQLDSETIYFIIRLLNQTNLKKIRNKVLISALPLRT
ncbi:hypothetical protein OAP04_00685 [Pelagibacteraceae bacterium]|jgi:hypothetical protein|nr:hypothetical protein [Pelagibacteraceae bacterium]